MARVKQELSELQREKTAEWLLNISQGVILGVIVAAFLPGLQGKVQVGQVIAGSLLGVVLYLLAIYALRGIKR